MGMISVLLNLLLNNKKVFVMKGNNLAMIDENKESNVSGRWLLNKVYSIV
jgi:hypothetical protein